VFACNKIFTAKVCSIWYFLFVSLKKLSLAVVFPAGGLAVELKLLIEIIHPI
jgi:hypothetical protein